MSSTQPTSVSNNNNNNNNNALGKSKGKTKKKVEKLEFDLKLKNATPNWAQEMEDDAENEVIPPSQLNLPDAPKAVSNEFDASQIPPDPPFKAHLRNIQFEVRVEDLYEHFKNVQVKDVQLINERQFCGAVIEFGTRKDLIDAFELTNRNLKGRIFSMSLRDDRDKDRGRGTRPGDRGGGFGRDSTPNDWRSSKDAVSVPPASIDPYDHGGGYNRGGGGGSRGGSYGNHDFPPPRNDYNRGGGYNDSRQMNDRGYDDRYANRPPRNNDYGGGRSGNWSRDNDPLPQESGFDSAPDDWRHGAPPPQPQYDHRRHHVAGAKSSSDRSPPRYRDQRAMPASRMTDNYRNEDDYNFRQPPVNERRLEEQPPPPPQSAMDRRPAGPRSEDLYEIPRRGDFDRSGHRNPPLMDHPPRERLSSTRSNISDHLVGEQQQQPPSSSSLPYDKSANLSPQQAPVVPKDRKPLINASILGALVETISDNKPANYSNSSSIFGDAKPVDTSKKEMEIEKKILSSKPAVPDQTTTTGAAVVSTSPASSSATPPPREDGSVSGSADGQAGNVPPSRSGGEYQDSQIPPRYARRTNGGIGGNRPMGGGGVGGGGGMPPRRDYDHDRNGALGGGRRDGGRMGGPPSGPPRDNRNMRNDLRRGGDGSREFWSGGGGGGSGQRRFNTDRIGGRIGYNDNMRGPPPPLGSRYDRGMQMRSGGGGGGGPHGEYENERSRYHSSGSDYIDKDDSEQINYVTSNKYDRLNETEDHGLE